MKEFKTKSFKVGFEATDRFKKDLKQFISTSLDSAKTLSNYVKSYSIFIEPNPELRLSKISRETELNPNHIITIFRIIRFLMVGELKEDETINDLADDLFLGEYLLEEEKNLFIELARIFTPQIKIFREHEKEREFIIKGAPIIGEIKWTSNLRLLPMNPFKYGESIDDYKPEIKKFIPIATIELSVNTIGEKQTVNFQADLDEIDEIITKLKAVKKELVILSKFAKETNNE
ncbi:hypothetical protein ISS30_01410 [bacterium]|nr:hypothetical protein [Bacteroidota bacterium]MBL7190327.1 hypothetical protein [bacterium]